MVPQNHQLRQRNSKFHSAPCVFPFQTSTSFHIQFRSLVEKRLDCVCICLCFICTILIFEFLFRRQTHFISNLAAHLSTKGPIGRKLCKRLQSAPECGRLLPTWRKWKSQNFGDRSEFSDRKGNGFLKEPIFERVQNMMWEKYKYIQLLLLEK